MKFGRKAALLALLTAAAAGGQAALPLHRPESAQALLEAQPEERREELLEEHMVMLPSDGLPAGQVEALVLFSQPTEKVWELLVQRERQREFRPEITALSIVERSVDRLIEEQHLKIAFLDIAYRLENRFDVATRTITWQIDPSFESTLEHVSGYWELHAVDAKSTLARFGTRVSVSPAVPGFLQSGITRKNVPESLENTRAWVDSNGRWRP